MEFIYRVGREKMNRMSQKTIGGVQRNGGDRTEHRVQWLNVDGACGGPG